MFILERIAAFWICNLSAACEEAEILMNEIVYCLAAVVCLCRTKETGNVQRKETSTFVKETKPGREG